MSRPHIMTTTLRSFPSSSEDSLDPLSAERSWERGRRFAGLGEQYEEGESEQEKGENEEDLS